MGIDQSYYDQEMASEHILDVESGYSRYDRGVTITRYMTFVGKVPPPSLDSITYLLLIPLT